MAAGLRFGSPATAFPRQTPHGSSPTRSPPHTRAPATPSVATPRSSCDSPAWLLTATRPDTTPQSQAALRQLMPVRSGLATPRGAHSSAPSPRRRSGRNRKAVLGVNAVGAAAAAAFAAIVVARPDYVRSDSSSNSLTSSGRVLSGAHLGHKRSAARRDHSRRTSRAPTAHGGRAGSTRRLRARRLARQRQHGRLSCHDGTRPSQQRTPSLPLTTPVSAGYGALALAAVMHFG